MFILFILLGAGGPRSLIYARRGPFGINGGLRAGDDDGRRRCGGVTERSTRAA
jgi:hypothetical protein